MIGILLKRTTDKGKEQLGEEGVIGDVVQRAGRYAPVPAATLGFLLRVEVAAGLVRWGSIWFREDVVWPRLFLPSLYGWEEGGSCDPLRSPRVPLDPGVSN